MYNMEHYDDTHIIYYIDQYIDGFFMSRSEPFYEKDLAISYFTRVTYASDSDSGIFYRISVSMSLSNYENIKLESQRIKIKFLDTPITKGSLVDSEEEFQSMPSKRINAFKYDNGYVILNKKSNLCMLESHDIAKYFTFVGKKNHFYITKQHIKQHDINLLSLVKVKPLSDKVANLLNT